MNRLQGQIAIVTGASRREGIGAAICHALACEGADIFFTHYQSYDTQVSQFIVEEAWSTVFAEELRRQYGVRVESMELNIAESNAAVELLDQVEAMLGLPHILINNATYSVDVSFRELNAEILDAHHAVNVRGTFLLTAEFARRLEGQHGGRIVNMVSGQDKGPMPGNLAYASTKGAISTFTRSLSAELAPLSITVNAVDPGPTDTGWMSEELKQELLPLSPMGRLGVPQDAARLIAFLASPEAEWITGQIIHSDGGFR